MSTLPKPKRRYYTTPEGKRRMVRCMCNSKYRYCGYAMDAGLNAKYINEGEFDNRCSVCGYNFFYIDGKLETPSE